MARGKPVGRSVPSYDEEEDTEENGHEEDEELSTSSDEDVRIGHDNKRQKKYYQPNDDELFEMEDSGDEDLVGEQEESEESLRDHVRKMKAKKESTEADEGGIEIDSDEDYDEDEAALQHALALSLAKTSEAEGSIPIRTPPSRRSLDASRRKYDPEENALQQALAASMTETEGILDGMRVSDANESDPPQGQNDTQPASNFSSRNNSRFTSPTRESRPIAIDGHDTPGKGPAKSKTRKKASKPSFPAPTLAMVQQAFNMLDPHGSGAVNPYALREVASKLLQKDLDDEQLLAMMEFAQSMTDSGQESVPGVVDAEGFCRLVARFADQQETD